MAKTYGTVTTFTAGSVLTAAQMNTAGTAINNLVVPAMCRVRRNSNQAIGNAVNNLVNFDVEDFDTDNMFSPTSNVITIQTAGVYSVSCSGGVQIHPTGVRGTFIVVNPTISGSGDSATITAGTRISGAWTNTVNAGGINTMIACSTFYNFSVGDTVGMCLYQNAGGSLSFVVSGSEQMSLSLQWVGRTS